MFPDMSMKSCYIPCPKHMVDSGQCSCVNRQMNSQDDWWDEYLKDIKKRVREKTIDNIINDDDNIT